MAWAAGLMIESMAALPISEARTLSEVVAAMEASGACGIVDEDFARDVGEGIARRGIGRERVTVRVP